MSLRLFFDENMENPVAAEEFEDGEPDEVKDAVQSGETLTDETVLYLGSTDTTLTYENITIEQIEGTSDNDVNVEYAEDDGAGNPDTYSDPLNLPDGDYDTPVPIHRKAEAPNVTNAFNRDDIRHRKNFDEFKKE